MRKNSTFIHTPHYTFTPQGYADVKREYEELLTKRPAAVEDLSKARSLGDLSENGYYKAARFKLNDLDRRLRQLKLFIKYGKIVEADGTDRVGIGNTVQVVEGETERSFTIVGSFEADPSEGKISDRSPLGSILMGKRVNDEVTLTTPNNTKILTIKKIS